MTAATKPETEPVIDMTHSNLTAALAAFQAELPTIAKDNTAKVESQKGSYSYKYADLAEISPKVLPLLGKHGLAWSTQPTLMGNEFVLHYSLTHESGEAIEGLYPLPSASTPPQQLGSAITYARRYALCAVTGVAPGGDDDDAASAPAAPQRQRAERAPEPPKASKDWAADLVAVKDVEQLRAVHVAVEEEGQLGYLFSPAFRKHLDDVVAQFGLPAPPSNVTIGQLIGAIKNSLNTPAPMVDVPKGQPRKWLDEARKMTARLQVLDLSREARAAGADEGILDELGAIMQSLPDPDAAQPEASGGWAKPAEGPEDSWADAEGDRAAVLDGGDPE